MGREREPLKRACKGDCVVNITDIWRNPDMQRQAISEIKKLKRILPSPMSKEQPKPRYRIEYISFEEYMNRLRDSMLSSADFDEVHMIDPRQFYSTMRFISKLS